jgi:hypothetical protein
VCVTECWMLICTLVTSHTISGQQLCDICNANEVAPFSGQPLCDRCTGSVRTDNAKTKCICAKGEYLGEDELTCYSCPTGLDCSSDDVTFAELQVRRGWWRESNDSLSMYRCLTTEMCEGGHESTCQEFRTGPLCTLCVDGYSARAKLGKCEKCYDQDTNIYLTGAFALGFALCVTVLYYAILRSDQDALKQMKDENEALIDEFEAKLTSGRVEPDAHWTGDSMGGVQMAFGGLDSDFGNTILGSAAQGHSAQNMHALQNKDQVCARVLASECLYVCTCVIIYLLYHTHYALDAHRTQRRLCLPSSRTNAQPESPMGITTMISLMII